MLDYVLGIDLGANSLGWLLLKKDGENPASVLACGSRIFEAGVEGGMDKIARGADEPKAAQRREARLQRRQTWRRARKRYKLFLQLQEAGLLPAGDTSLAQNRHEILCDLDKAITETLEIAATDTRRHQLLPYLLRAKALDDRLDPHQLGRAIYHLAQRRGFLSNRVAPIKDGEKQEGKVYSGIGELREQMENSGARTLGEHFAGLNPAETRIRRRWTHRSMFEHEFEQIWTAQAPRHPGLLTPELKKTLHHTLFHQRPLKIKRELLGNCEFEPRRKRAPWALLSAQRFRYLQKVNDLRITSPDGIETSVMDLPEARQKLIAELDHRDERNFGQIKKLLGVSKEHHLNLERGGEKKLKGNVTAGRIYKVLKKQWDQLYEADREAIVEDLRSIGKEPSLVKRGMERWGLDAETAKKFAKIRLEPGHCFLSRQALDKIVPLLEEGIPYATRVSQS